MQPSRDKERTYVFDSENAAELARNMSQDRQVTRSMGGALPELPAMDGIRRVLDIACGPGGWAIDLAFDHPELEVVGFDISSTMIEYACLMVQQLDLDNVEFFVMDALASPFEFPDGSFDLVNARLLFSFMPQGAWPRLLRECRRILHPGGYIRLTEGELPFTNSVSFDRLIEIGHQSLVKRGLGFSSAGRYVGITPMLGKFLGDAGFRVARETAHALNASQGTEGFPGFYNDHLQVFELLKPFIKHAGVVPLVEFEGWAEQATRDMQSPDFRAIWYALTVLGEAL